MHQVDKATVAEMVDAKLPWNELKDLMSAFKDADRFDKYVEVLQERVSWDEKIILLLGARLNIVRKQDGSLVTKSQSGHEFGDYRENWKLQARIFVRNTDEEYQEIYPKHAHADPDWMELREYYDPVDGSLLDIEAVPSGYPVMHNFKPDLEIFYNDWLGRPISEAN